MDHADWRRQVKQAATAGTPALSTFGFADNQLRNPGHTCPYSKLGLCVAVQPKGKTHQTAYQCCGGDGADGASKRCLIVLHVACGLDSVSENASGLDRTKLKCPLHLVRVTKPDRD